MCGMMAPRNAQAGHDNRYTQGHSGRGAGYKIARGPDPRLQAGAGGVGGNRWLDNDAGGFRRVVSFWELAESRVLRISQKY